jgi:hypothetical protein
MSATKTKNFTKKPIIFMGNIIIDFIYGVNISKIPFGFRYLSDYERRGANLPHQVPLPILLVLRSILP